MNRVDVIERLQRLDGPGGTSNGHAPAPGRHVAAARWLLFLVMVPTVMYAIVKLYRSIAIVFAIAWYGSGRGVRISAKGVEVFTAALVVHLVAVEVVGWIRRNDQAVGLASLLVYLTFVGGAWLLMHFVFETKFYPAIAPVLLVAVVMTLLAIAIGLATGREVFRETPMAALREA